MNARISRIAWGSRGPPSNGERQPSSTPDDHVSSPEQMGIELALEMRERWRGGEQMAAEEFFRRRPELCDHPEAALDLIYEEYCLRQSAGEKDVEEDLLRRFPGFAAALRVMLDCHRRVLQSESDQPQYPCGGERLGEFELLWELARGSHGRVFLAEQTGLAARPVVLKIAPLDGGEHVSLARLQHSNIVPLYSVLDDPRRRIRVLCMPFFGCATLASVLESLADVAVERRSGTDIVSAIHRLQRVPVGLAAAAGEARQMLARLSYANAMTWIAAQLADALAFAHERQMVHLDLKPSNILLGTDGQPMLLDFHLAREPVQKGAVIPQRFGGTLPYMPPEQQAAMRSLQEGRAAEVTVDGRADIYALGAVLYEALGGQLPIDADSPALMRVNPHPGRGLSDIVAKCTAARPEDRYADAGALAADLRRHLADQPLVGVANRSAAERWRKWRRRRPAALRTAGLLAVIAATVLVLAASLWTHLHHRREQAELALHDGLKQMQRPEKSGDAVQSLERGLRLVENQPFQRELRQQLRDQLGAARRLHLGWQVHQLADKVRALYGAESIAADRMKSLAVQCDALWQKRHAMIDVLGSTRDTRRDTQLAMDLQDTAIFAAHLHARLSEAAPSRDELRAAMRTLDEVAEMFGVSAVLEHDRHLYRSILEKGSPAQPPAAWPAPRTAWEHYALGRALLASGDLARASIELEAALKRDPAGRWPNFYHGLCAYRLGRYGDAVAAFSVCVGAAPDVEVYYYNRALAHAAMENKEAALRDYSSALQMNGAHESAALNRGVIHLELGRHQQAIADLHLALKNGAEPAGVHYNLALVHRATGNHAMALGHVRRAMQHNPSHARAQHLREALGEALGETLQQPTAAQAPDSTGQ